MYLANLCNSIIIEIYVDIIRVSHGFSRIDMLFFKQLSLTVADNQRARCFSN